MRISDWSSDVCSSDLALLTPGNCSALSISWIRLSKVTPSRHSPGGLRLTTVSNISVGAGSVAELMRPALPHTDATSSEERREGQGCVRRCGSGWCRYHNKKKTTKYIKTKKRLI